MGLNIYFRSIDPMHPSTAYSIRQATEKLNRRFSWILCDEPIFHHNRDGHFSGAVAPLFGDEAIDSLDDEIGDVGTLMVVVDILAKMSAEFEVDWEFSHDYEPDPIGRIIQGHVEPDLIDEIDSVISIGSLFGELIDEDDEDDVWGTDADAGVWDVPVTDGTLRFADLDEPHVIKFPGVE